MTDLPQTAVDPVCGMNVEIATATPTYEHEGKKYYFCSEKCKELFSQNPQQYLQRQLNATGALLGSNTDDITGTVWLLGHDLKSPIAIVISTLEMLVALHEGDEDLAMTVQL